MEDEDEDEDIFVVVVVVVVCVVPIRDGVIREAGRDEICD